MALIKCEECGKEISDRANACPHCGCPITHISEPVTRNNFATACLFISHLLGFAYTLFCLIYWASAGSRMSGFEKLGADIATVMMIPHVALVVLATVFNTFALFSYHRCFSLTAAILYCGSILFMPLYFYFVIIQAILCFIAFFLMQSKGKVSIKIKELISTVSVLCAMISVIIICSNIGNVEDNKKAEVSSTESTTEQTAATTEASTESSLLINQPQTSTTETLVPREYQSALNQAQSYSNTMHMSEAAIYDQLISEYGGQFNSDAAQYAIENVNADYYYNALESAKSYSETMDMSSDAIYDQLISDYGGKFTEDQASYAVQHLYD